MRVDIGKESILNAQEANGAVQSGGANGSTNGGGSSVAVNGATNIGAGGANGGGSSASVNGATKIGAGGANGVAGASEQSSGANGATNGGGSSASVNGDENLSLSADKLVESPFAVKEGEADVLASPTTVKPKMTYEEAREMILEKANSKRGSQVLRELSEAANKYGGSLSYSDVAAFAAPSRINETDEERKKRERRERNKKLIAGAGLMLGHILNFARAKNGNAASQIVADIQTPFAQAEAKRRARNEADYTNYLSLYRQEQADKAAQRKQDAQESKAYFDEGYKSALLNLRDKELELKETIGKSTVDKNTAITEKTRTETQLAPKKISIEQQKANAATSRANSSGASTGATANKEANKEAIIKAYAALPKGFQTTRDITVRDATGATRIEKRTKTSGNSENEMLIAVNKAIGAGWRYGNGKWTKGAAASAQPAKKPAATQASKKRSMSGRLSGLK